MNVLLPFRSVINNQNSMLFIALDTLLRTIKFQLASEKIFSFFFACKIVSNSQLTLANFIISLTLKKVNAANKKTTTNKKT